MPFFQEGVFFVPQGQGEANELAAIANTGQAVFIPAVGAGPGVVKRQVLPGCSVRDYSLPARFPRHVRSGRVPSVSSAFSRLLDSQSLISS